jgi:hypothetical protein
MLFHGLIADVQRNNRSTKSCRGSSAIACNRTNYSQFHQLTHHGLLNNGLSIGRCMRLGPTDVLCEYISTYQNLIISHIC